MLGLLQIQAYQELLPGSNKVPGGGQARVATIAKPTGSKLVKRPAESGEICSGGSRRKNSEENS
jgi:hypothetical protein